MDVKIALVVLIVSSQPGAKNHVKTFDYATNPVDIHAELQQCNVDRLFIQRDYEEKVKGTSYHVTTKCYRKMVPHEERKANEETGS